jgi:hypothetical protein
LGFGHTVQLLSHERRERYNDGVCLTGPALNTAYSVARPDAIQWFPGAKFLKATEMECHTNVMFDDGNSQATTQLGGLHHRYERRAA